MVSIPTISELYANNLAALQDEFSITIDPDGKSFLAGFAAVQAGKQWLQYLGLGDIQKNVWPDLAESEDQGGTLERFGRVKNLVPFQGTQGQYACSVIGSAGAIIPAGATFKSDDSSLNPSFLFTLDSPYTLIGTGDIITLRSLTVGTVALLAVGNTLTCTQPLANINTQVTVTSISISPIDAETIEQFRSRVLETYTLEPQGGSAADYRLWGREAAGVAQIYPYAVSGMTDVVAVYVEAILSDSTDGKGTPSGTILSAVSAIMAASNGLKPLGVMPVRVNPVNVLEVDITFTGSTGTVGISPAQRILITNALIEAVALIRPFIAGVDALVDRNDTISDNVIIQIALNAAPGCFFTGVSLTVGGASAPTYTFDNGNIPYLNPAITYA